MNALPLRYLGKGGWQPVKILALPGLAYLPPLNPGTLVDSATKVRKYDSQDFDDKSA